MRLKRASKAKKKPKKKKPSKRRVVPRALIAGLRNPGPDYEGTRHNIGFEAVERVVRRAGEELGRAPSRVRGLIAQLGFGEDRSLLLAPTVFMNESGQAVRSALGYYKIETPNLLVAHDDIDLEFGRLRLQVAGGSGGHNGIRSLERALGTNEFSRLKIGVGRPPGSMDPADYVLRRFSKSELEEVDLMVEDAADVIEAWLDDRSRAQEMASLRGRDV